MKIDKNKFRIYYDLVSEFINVVDTNNVETLKGKFGLISEVVEELNEELDCYYEVRPEINILPFDEAYRCMIEEERGFEIFKFNDVECWGIDCNLVINGKIDEPLFHFRICKNDKEYNLEFLYIGS
jgi:hypothetical protein